MLSGKVKTLIIGFMNMLISVRHAPTTKTTHGELTIIPSKNWAVSQTDAEIINHLKISFIWIKKN